MHVFCKAFGLVETVGPEKRAEAGAFFNCLCEIYESEQNKLLPAISEETIEYWRKGLSRRS